MREAVVGDETRRDETRRDDDVWKIEERRRRDDERACMKLLQEAGRVS